MPSPKTQVYDVEKIISKRTDPKGHIFYLIKWKGYSMADNTWEPESHVANCKALVKEFEDEEAKKIKSRNSSSKENHGQAIARVTRSSQLLPQESTDKSMRTTRSSHGSSPTRTQGKRRSNSHYAAEHEAKKDNSLAEKKATPVKRLRKSTSDTEVTSSVDILNGDVLDTEKLDQILNVRRDKKSNKVEYYIQVKKIKKPLWIASDRLTECYNQEVVEFLENKYV